MNKDWWKWGDSKAFEHVNNYPKLKQICNDRFGMHLKEDFHPPQEFNIEEVNQEDKTFFTRIFSMLSVDQIQFSKEKTIGYCTRQKLPRCHSDF